MPRYVRTLKEIKDYEVELNEKLLLTIYDEFIDVNDEKNSELLEKLYSICDKYENDEGMDKMVRDEFDVGYLSGILAALRYARGYDKDNCIVYYDNSYFQTDLLPQSSIINFRKVNLLDNKDIIYYNESFNRLFSDKNDD